MKSRSEHETVERKKRLARIIRVSGNKICADCPETRPTWISFVKPQQNFALGSKVLASFVCLECAGLHRKLGTHICVVRSISHDQFEEKDVDCAEYSGNDVVNEIFEGHLQKSTMDGINIKPLLGAEVARRERFIRQKYVDLYFYRKRAHYQHIAAVNKDISNARKQQQQQQHSRSHSHSKSPGGSRSKSSSPSKPFRKKLSLFLHNKNDENNNNNNNSEKNGTKTTSGCSMTVGNTTMTPEYSTSQTRTVTERDDSTKSGSRKMGGGGRDSRDDSHKSSDTKKRDKQSSSKKRSSKNGTTSTRRKKGQKKSSSQRRLKSTSNKNDHHLTIDPMFDEVPSSNEAGTITRIGEMSIPLLPQQPQQQQQPQPQPNIRNNDLNNSKSPTNNNTIGTTIKRTSRERDDLSGMLLVFDEESSCPSLESESNMRRRDRRKSSRDLDRRSSNTNTNTNTNNSVGSSGNHHNPPTVVLDDALNHHHQKPPAVVDLSSNTNNHHQQNDHDPSNEFHRKLPMNSTSESCVVNNSTRENPLAIATSTRARDARRSRSEITIDEITKKHRDGSTSPGHVGKQIFSRTRRMNQNNKSGSLRRLDVKMPLQQGDTSLLREHLKRETRISTSARNLRIPYLESSPLSPMSIEGFVSEGTSYGFGDNTVNNMSGTGEEHNNRSSVVEDTSYSTENGFRLIDNTNNNTTTKTGGSGSNRDCSSSCQGVSWETTSGSSFALPFKNKKAADGAIKNQSGRRSGNAAILLDTEDAIVATLDRADTPNEIDKPSRNLVNNKSKSNRSLVNKSNKSSSSCLLSNKFDMSITIDEPVMPIQQTGLSKNEAHAPCDSPPPSQKKKKKKRRKSKKSSKSGKRLSLRNQALLEEWERLKSENENKFADFNRTFSQHGYA